MLVAVIGQKPKHLPSLQMHHALPHPLSHAINIITISIVKSIIVYVLQHFQMLLGSPHPFHSYEHPDFYC